MGIPLKKSRRLVVDDRKYVYFVKETHIADHKDQLENSVTVQGIPDGEKKPSGQIMQFRVPWGMAITPALMLDAVRRALSDGWVPCAKGQPFGIYLFL